MVKKKVKGDPPMAMRFAPAAAGVFAFLAYFAARRAAITGGGEETSVAKAFVTRVVEALQSLAVYAQLIVVPNNLHMERTLGGVPTWYAGVGAVLLCVLILIIAVAWRGGHPRIVMAGGLFLIAWFPISGIIPLNAPLAEHWMYVPLAGVLWLVAEGVLRAAKAWDRPLVAPAFAGIAMLALLPVTVDRNEDWKDNITLFEATLEDNPNSIRVRQNLAVAQEAVEENLPAAVGTYRALAAYYDQTRPEGTPPTLEELEVHLFLGKSYLELGRPDAAMRHFQRVMVVSDDARFREFTAAAVVGIGEAFVDQGSIVQAEQFLSQWIQAMPEIADSVWEILGGRSLGFQRRR